ncbi:uncharacterized protein LOC131243336 isoform X3 [Magnolia sinica]|uniref:uncharacterized protein LOC131243336 isoform X3 n=1 Tax=Magnolia sinica TaxID=86752 RepID=UPI0026585FF8|nr:uncharacterized protein LOC131243336 isoform X3 [Magnolia sinica]
MSVENGTRSSEEDARKEDENILLFLDSMDSYLTLFDSLSSTLRQGWLELASARHSMGTSRITSALFDLKLHSAATTLQVNLPYDESASGDPTVNQPHFTLSKWASLSDRKCDSGEVEIDEELQKKSYNSQLRHRGPSTDVQEKDSETNGKTLAVDDQVSYA